MTLYRFLARSFHLGRIIEAGEVVDLPEDTVPGAHMDPIGEQPTVDATAAEAEATAEPEAEPQQPEQPAPGA